MNPVRILLGMAPWILFSLIVHDTGPQVATVIAAVLSLVLAIWQRRLLEFTSLAVFVVLAVLAQGGAANAEWVAVWGRTTAAVVLAAVMLVSAATVPFTEAYAKESVPQQYWGSPRFREANRKISALWGLVVLGMAVSHVIAALINPDAATAGLTSGHGNLLLNWVIPILLVVQGVKQTQRLARQAPAADPRQTADPR